MPEIFISYAWKDADQPADGSREQIVDELCAALAERGHTVRRDKNELTYKADIRRFMERIGAGGYVVAVVSHKYLRSPYCMFEAKEMLAHRDFAERVFPIVLPDAKVFSAEKTDYSTFWKNEKEQLAARLEPLRLDAGIAELLEELRDLEEISLRVQTFIAEVKRLNVLSAEAHASSNFAQLIAALERKMQTDAPPRPPEPLGELPVFQNIDAKSLGFDHALRPEFTRSVAHTLFQERRSVNLHAPYGWGRSRLAKDLAQALHDAPVRIVRINLHNYISGYPAFLADLAAQLRVGHSEPELCDLIEGGCRKLGFPVLLVLENLDAVMRDNPAKDPRFNGDFLTQLNGLRNGGFCRLLALSEKAHNEYRFNGVSSWLDVKILQLPEFSERNIGAEMDRRLPSADPALRTYVIEQVETEPREPCCLLDDLLRYLESNECSRAAAKHFILDYRKKH